MYNSNINKNYQTAEYGKFIELISSNYPAISVTRFSYPDTTNAFPDNTNAPILTSVEIFPKYAVLSQITNPEDISFTVYLSAENVSVELGEIEKDLHGVVSLCNTMTAQNADLNSYVNDLEKNTFDTASAVDDVYYELIKTNNLIKTLSSFYSTVTNTVGISTAQTLPISGAVTVLNAITATVPNGIHVSYTQDSGNVDAFGRLRASMPTTLFDSKTLHNKASLFWSQTATNGASVYFTSETSDASVTLSATGINQYAIRQTTQRFNYQPGKSQLAIFTGILNPVSNAIKRYGLFQSLTAAPYDPNCGLYFETQTDSPSSIAVVQHNNGFLVPSVSARRENWNIDKLDGTGPSGKVLTLSAANIFLIDYEWLGVGRVRFGTVIDGAICYCHAINNAGNVQGAYIKTPNLPVRAEIRQTGAGTSSMKIICCSVMSEGGADFTGVTRSIDAGDYPGLTIAAGARRAILGVRLNAAKLDSVNEVINASVTMIPQGASTQAAFHYELLHNPTLSAGGTWQSIADSSNFDYWRGSVEIGDEGTVIASGYGSVGSALDLSNSKFEKFLRMGCSVTGKRDELYLVVTPLQNNLGVYGAITFLESD